MSAQAAPPFRARARLGRALSDPDRAAIERAVAEAEARTSAQIVVVVADRSSSYFAHRAVAAFASAVALSLLVYLLVPVVNAGLVLVGQLVMTPLLWLLFGARPLLLPIVPDDTEQDQVAERAKLAFVDHRVFDTQSHAGVLLFVSLLEHRVHVLADTEVPPHIAQRCAQTLLESMRQGALAAAIEKAIFELGSQLQERFPKAAPDGAGLPDEVRIERDR